MRAHLSPAGDRPVSSGPPTGRPAFSLVELLVVFGIVGLLIGLTLPAVQRARESGNYITCRNHLRQIGLAIHTFETSRGYFPGARPSVAVPGP